MKDYYALLGVDKDATKAELKKNYRKLAVAFHPDKNSDPSAAEKFIAVNEAYEVLSNKKSRVRYDLFRWEKLKRQEEPSSGTFTSAAPTFESPRSRRKKSQRKRSINYHQENNGFFKTMKLIQESLIVISRYFLHVIGITVFSVIFGSTLNQLSNAFDVTFFRGVIVSGFSLLIVYIIVKLLIHIITEYKKDLLEFSVFYKISQKKIVLISSFTFCVILIIYLSTVVKTIQRV